MNADIFIGLAAGAFVSFVVSSVFAGAKFTELWQQLQAEKERSAKLEAMLIEARDNMPIREWDKQWVVPVIEEVRREKLYDKYEDLIKPGSEVIRIDMDDVPDLDPMGHKDWTYE
jgi:hypothetical protein